MYRPLNEETVITIGHHDDQVPKPAALKLDRARALHELGIHITALSSGSRIGTVRIERRSGGTAASGVVTLLAASGVVSIYINGVVFSSPLGGTDTTKAAALVAAIAASVDPLVAPFVTASANVGAITIVARTKGVNGNLITLAVDGTGIEVSGNRLTGGAAGPAETTTV